MKNLILVLLCFISFASFGLAASDNLGDCKLFSQGQGLKAAFVDSFDIDEIYPEKNRTIAIQNLKKYCCASFPKDAKEKQWGCDEYQDNNYANSNFLYDHLIDVGFRSLDGDKELAYDGQDLDVLGVQWHELLYGKNSETPGYANNPNGSIPFQVRKDFGLYWGINEKGSVQYNLNDFKSPKENITQYANYIQRRSTLPTTETNNSEYVGLASRYFIICHISQQIIAKGGVEVNGFSACKSLALKRINDEFAYISYVLSNQGMTALMNNFNAYTQGYFVQGELGRLLEKITEMNAGLAHINNKVSEMTRMCGG